MALTHTHYCEHCDRTFTCHEGSECLLGGENVYKRRPNGARVLLGSSISKLHQCEEAIRYRKAVRNAMRDNNTGCRYGCSRLPCVHGAAIRFPRVGGPVSHPDEPGRHEQVFVPFVWRKPDGRRLREYIDSQRDAMRPQGAISSAIGKALKIADTRRGATNAQTAEPTFETLAIANVERNETVSSEVANAENAAASENATDMVR